MHEDRKPDELRRKAELMAGERGREEEGSQHLLHELRVHEIELELQNEELRATRRIAEENYAQYQELYESAPVSLVSLNNAGTIIHANRAAEKLLKTRGTSVIGHPLSGFAAKEESAGLLAFLALVHSSDQHLKIELTLRTRSADPVYVQIVAIKHSDKKDDSLLAIIDLSDREKLDRAAREKTELMFELQHRVKNNLNVVQSLLSLGQSEINDPKAIEILQKSRARVLAMSKIYEQLYRTETILEVDLWSYLEQMIGTLLETYSVDVNRYRLVKTFQRVRIDAQRAALAGLVFNELISNATKYAYPPGSAGELRVSLTERDGYIVLSVSDDGPGLPAGFNFEKCESMGFEILRMLSEQMDAELAVDSPDSGGLTVTVRIRTEAKRQALNA